MHLLTQAAIFTQNVGPKPYSNLESVIPNIIQWVLLNRNIKKCPDKHVLLKMVTCYFMSLSHRKVYPSNYRGSRHYADFGTWKIVIFEMWDCINLLFYVLRKFPYLHVSWICISENFVVGELLVVPTLPMPKAEQIGRPRYPYVWKIKCCFIKSFALLCLPSALLFCGSNTSAFSNSRSRLTFAHLAKDAGSAHC